MRTARASERRGSSVTLGKKIAMLYTVTQVVLKIVLTCVIGVPALLGIIWVWRHDVDVAKTVSPKRIAESITPKPSFIVAREESGIYQDGELRAVVDGAVVDEAASVVTFAEVSRSGSLDLGKSFEFRKYVLTFAGADAVIGSHSSYAEKGRMIIKVRCVIKSVR